ncbi:DHH family phosphoesterase [Endozoicomonas sp. OPT23]|uniref:DHH family phosphoesterase n=1 Tax=Endozoicomonas sp. OPT23 TaxID=2072845 RepID=UPI00129A42FB|nr:DHH family phosphoesterase [Endozoicomonas sp. OPT23]
MKPKTSIRRRYSLEQATAENDIAIAVDHHTENIEIPDTDLILLHELPDSHPTVEVVGFINHKNGHIGATNSGLARSLESEFEQVRSQLSFIHPAIEAANACGGQIIIPLTIRNSPVYSQMRIRIRQLDREFRKISNKYGAEEEAPELNDHWKSLTPGWNFFWRSVHFAQDYWSYVGFAFTSSLAISSLFCRYTLYPLIETSLTDYIPQPEVDFTGCEIMVIIDTDELYKDLERAEITDTPLDATTPSNLIIDYLDNAGKKAFQTTGLFSKMLTVSEKCRCHECPGDHSDSSIDLSGCLVHIQVLTNVLRTTIAQAVSHRYNNSLNNPSLIKGYILSFDETGNISNNSLAMLDQPTIMAAACDTANSSASSSADSATCRGCSQCAPVATKKSLSDIEAAQYATQVAVTLVLFAGICTTATGILKCYQTYWLSPHLHRQ